MAGYQPELEASRVDKRVYTLARNNWLHYTSDIHHLRSFFDTYIRCRISVRDALLGHPDLEPVHGALRGIGLGGEARKLLSSHREFLATHGVMRAGVHC